MGWDESWDEIGKRDKTAGGDESGDGIGEWG